MDIKFVTTQTTQHNKCQKQQQQQQTKQKKKNQNITAIFNIILQITVMKQMDGHQGKFSGFIKTSVADKSKGLAIFRNVIQANDQAISKHASTRPEKQNKK